ncbi:PEP-CTERM sorting domain-containing protein [Planctomycetota bacterium]
MKKLIIIFTLAVSLAALVSIVKADIQVNVSFDLETHGGNDSWTSTPNVDTGYPQYDYEWQINYVDLELDNSFWTSILGYIPVTSGSGTAYELPFVISDDHWEETGVFNCDVYSYVDNGGWGHVSVTNVNFGQVESYEVTGLRFGGDATVTAVPEPATVSMFALGGLVFFAKRRRTRKRPL